MSIEKIELVKVKVACSIMLIGSTKLWYLTKEGHEHFDPKAPRRYHCGKRGVRFRRDHCLHYAQGGDCRELSQ